MKLKNIVPFLLLGIICSPLAVFANTGQDIDPMTVKMPHDVFEKTIDFDTYVWTIDFIVDPRTQYNFDQNYWEVHIVDIPEFMGYLKDNSLNGGYSDSPSGWFCIKPIKEGNTSLWADNGESHWVNIVEHLN